METKTIMLACSAGMSTSLLVSKMQAAAKKTGVDYKIFATAASDVPNQLTSAAKPDVLMLGPQIAYMKADMQKQADQAGIPMAIINMQDYGMMNGAGVLSAAEKLMKAK